MNKYTKQNIFVTVSQPLNALVAFKGHFTDQTDRYPYPLLLHLENSLHFHILKSEKGGWSLPV